MLLSQQQPQPAAPPPGMFAGTQKSASRKNFHEIDVRAWNFYPQALRASKENPPQYDEQASGPTVGRYISSDPIGLSGGLNPFNYANVSPANWIDPSGQLFFVPPLLAGAAMLGIMTLTPETVEQPRTYDWIKNASIFGFSMVILQDILSEPQGCLNPNSPFKDPEHIFSDKEGHLTDTPENRKFLQDLVNDPSNKVGPDKYGNTWYSKDMLDGTQGWARVFNGQIYGGGINETPRTYNPDTGLSFPLKP